MEREQFVDYGRKRCAVLPGGRTKTITETCGNGSTHIATVAKNEIVAIFQTNNDCINPNTGRTGNKKPSSCVVIIIRRRIRVTRTGYVIQTLTRARACVLIAVPGATRNANSTDKQYAPWYLFPGANVCYLFDQNAILTRKFACISRTMVF